jgi:hypothetical protein
VQSSSWLDIYIVEECELLNKYFSFISSLEDANVPLPDIELKTDNFMCNLPAGWICTL